MFWSSVDINSEDEHRKFKDLLLQNNVRKSYENLNFITVLRRINLEKT